MSRPSGRLAGALFGLGLCLLVAGGCQKMAGQPYYRPYEDSSFFADGTSARPIPDDTVARGNLRDDPVLFSGKSNGADVDQFPFPVDRQVLDRGRDRFSIFCAPCHGLSGYGDGMIVQRGFLPPPSFHTDRLRQAPVGHFFDVATNGFGAMPPYADQVPVRDRWAIVAYIRALQLSQDAGLDDVPPDQRAALERQP
jgi:mono/diheme cytochrome c family protein